MSISATSRRGRGWPSNVPWVRILPPGAPFAHRSRDTSSEPRDPSASPYLSIKSNFLAYALVGAAGAMVWLVSSDLAKHTCDQMPGGSCEIPKMTATSSAAATVSIGSVFVLENTILGDDLKVVVDLRSFSGKMTDTRSGAIFSRFG